MYVCMHVMRASIYLCIYPHTHTHTRTPGLFLFFFVFVFVFVSDGFFIEGGGHNAICWIPEILLFLGDSSDSVFLDYLRHVLSA